jgi:tRNA/rRNA methyltransferase
VPPVRVILVSPRNPLNIGAAARAMSNFGFAELRLVAPYAVAWQEARSAVGPSLDVLAAARVFPTLAAAIADCRLVVGTTSHGPKGLHLPLRRLEAGARLLRKTLPPAALVFGSEKHGLSLDDFSHCHWLLRIPSREEHPSMNLGQAVALCLYELVRDGRALAPETTRRAPVGDLDRLTDLLLEVLAVAGYTNRRTAASTARKVRRLVRRLNLDPKDAEVLLGMLRQIRWRLGDLALHAESSPDVTP